MHLLIYMYVQIICTYMYMSKCINNTIIRKEDTGHPREMIVKGWGP